MLKMHRQITAQRTQNKRLTARTGTHCPLSGWWAPHGDKTRPFLLLEGSIMPTSGNVAVEWALLEPMKGLPRHGLQA